jgi:hypothetical protein
MPDLLSFQITSSTGDSLDFEISSEPSPSYTSGTYFAVSLYPDTTVGFSNVPGYGLDYAYQIGPHYGIEENYTSSAPLFTGTTSQPVFSVGSYDLIETNTNDTPYGYLSGAFPATLVITDEGPTPCFCRGTRILTEDGEAAVEDLKIGDRVITGGCEIRPIRWIGTRSYTGRFVAGNQDVLPVLIKSGALADNVPKRNLMISPLHAMYIDGALVPAICLVNGRSIVQLEKIDQVEYFHIELDSHDVILAEGALSETYVDDDNRGIFHNAASFNAMYPNAGSQPVRYCAPRIEGGTELQAIHERLSARASESLASWAA